MLNAIEKGVLDKPDQFKEICTRLVSKNMKFCPGLDKEEYQQYRDIIRYDIKMSELLPVLLTGLIPVNVRNGFEYLKMHL